MRYNIKNSKYYSIWTENKTKILDLCKQGWNLSQISNEVGIPDRIFGDFAREESIPVNKKTRLNINHGFFDNLDSEIKFYLLGYFIADGCIAIESKKHHGIIDSKGYRLSVNVSTDDFDTIQLFYKYIGNQNKQIEHTDTQSGVKYKRKPQVRFRWSSKHMIDTLLSYDIVPNKTLHYTFKLKSDWIKSPFIYDLIRGLIDGDGHIGKSNIQLCLNSKELANQLSNFFSKRFQNCSSCRITENQGKTCKWWILNINGGKKFLKEYYEKCYHDTTFCLSRKLHNIEETLGITKGSKAP